MKHLFKRGSLLAGLALVCLLTACAEDSTKPSASDDQEHIHNFGQWVVTQASCTQDGWQERVCDCGEKETQTIEATGHQETVIQGREATCTQTGLTEGKYCAVCHAVLEEQQEITATDHQAVKDQAKAPTCTESGLTEGQHCSVCNTVLVKQEKIDPLGHEFKNYVSDENATCAEDGTETAKCSRCDATDTHKVENSAKGHKVVVDPGVNATCIKTGLTEGSHCAVCSKVLVAQELVPAKGHEYGPDWCVRCGAQRVWTSRGLEFALSEDKKSYSVTGVGSCTDSNIVIPQVYNGLPVTSVAAEAFAGCENLMSVVMLEGITHIGDRAFQMCFNMIGVTIPEGLVSIGSSAFEMCSSLRNIMIPRSLSSIGEGAFWHCYAMQGVYISDMTQWCTIDFDGVGANPLSVAGNLYLNGMLVTYLTIPEDVEQISDYAFSQCTSLQMVTIGKKTTAIGSHAFYFCSNLMSVSLEKGVQTIGQSAFEGCGRLGGIYIPDTVTSVGQGAFIACRGMDYIVVAQGNPVYHSSDNCLIETATKKLVLGCKNSRIPTDGTVTAIADSAFHGCTDIEIIFIPRQVTSIGEYAFNHCIGLTKIVYEGSKTQWSVLAKHENWDWDTNAYAMTFQGKDPTLELVKTEITLSPGNGTTCDLLELVKNVEGFDKSLFTFTSADNTLIRVDGSKVTAQGNSSQGVVVTIRYGEQSVTCLIRSKDIPNRYKLNKTGVTLTLGKAGYGKFELKLVDEEGNTVRDVQWKFSNDFPKCCDQQIDAATGVVTITAKAVTTTLTNGQYVVAWTTYAGVKYQCIICVNSAN